VRFVPFRRAPSRMIATAEEQPRLDVMTGDSICPIPAVRPRAAALLLCCLQDPIPWLAPGGSRSPWRARAHLARFPRVARRSVGAPKGRLWGWMQG
jgi:hypothetical protein